MRQVSFSFPAPVTNSVAATQSWTTSTGAYVVLNGALSVQPYGTSDPAVRNALFPGIQRTIGVFATGSCTGIIFFASGIDTNGRVVTASFTGASGGSTTATDAFATFTVEFYQVNAIWASSIASTPFTIGTGASGSTRWVTMDKYPDPFAVGVAVITATGTVSIQDTPNDPNVATSPNIFTHATIALATANAQSNYAYPVNFVRAIVTNSQATGGSNTISIIQAGI